MNHFSRIANCLEWMAEHQANQPTLDDVAAQMNLSPAHAQRVFKQAVGLSPKQFILALTHERSRQLLAENETVLDAALTTGLSGASRLHDLFVNVEAMTPGEYRNGGAGLAVDWGVHGTPLGDMVVCQTDRGVAGLAFVTDTTEQTLSDFTARWPGAQLNRNQTGTRLVADQVFNRNGRRSLSLLLAGTPFQIQVWRALIELPDGARASYSQLAGRVGRPSSHRAVANAVGANPLAVLIPCHRVIRSTGAFGGYRWGVARKMALLAQEHARVAQR